MLRQAISMQTLQRLPLYVNYLKSLSPQTDYVSATSIANGLNLNNVQVRKDLAAVSSGGRPKVGYRMVQLIDDIQQFLSCNNADRVVIVGMGKLGHALAHYKGFQEYGQNIVALFDSDDAVIAASTYDKIYHVSKLPQLCSQLNASIAILTVPAENAQSMCDILVESGIRAIWNFAPVCLNVPDDVYVKNENMAVSLALLSRALNTNIF